MLQNKMPQTQSFHKYRIGSLQHANNLNRGETQPNQKQKSYRSSLGARQRGRRNLFRFGLVPVASVVHGFSRRLQSRARASEESVA